MHVCSWDEDMDDEGIDWVEEEDNGRLRQRAPAIEPAVRKQLEQEEFTLKLSRKQRKLEGGCCKCGKGSRGR